MVQILAGEKGEGKTKKLIAMANEAGKSANGSVVFVDDDNSRMYDLHYSVRFVDTPKFIMEDPQVFRGFVCGILSQNSDIEKIYIDGLNHIVDKVSDADFVKFIEELEKTSAEAETDIDVYKRQPFSSLQRVDWFLFAKSSLMALNVS